MRRPVIHAAPSGTHAFYAKSLESGETAIIVTTPIKVKGKTRLGWCDLDGCATPHSRAPGCVNWRPLFVVKGWKWSVTHSRIVRNHQRSRNQADSARSSQSDG